MDSNDQLLASLTHVRELEIFVYELLDKVRYRELPGGESLLPYAERAGVKVPLFLKGADVTRDSGTQFEAEFGDSEPLVLMRPGRVQVVGEIKSFCFRIGRIIVCVECGWLLCRIVIWGPNSAALEH